MKVVALVTLLALAVVINAQNNAAGGSGSSSGNRNSQNGGSRQVENSTDNDGEVIATGGVAGGAVTRTGMAGFGGVGGFGNGNARSRITLSKYHPTNSVYSRNVSGNTTRR